MSSSLTPAVTRTADPLAERNFDEGGHTPSPPPRRPTAFGAILRWSWLIVVLAAVVGAAVYVVSDHITATYSSSAKVVVSVSGGTDVNDSSLGANNIASQDAQLVAGGQVVALAERASKLSIPSASISGGVVGAQNLISVQATASSPVLAQRRAQAVATAFIAYVDRQAAQQASAARRQALTGLVPLNSQINSLQRQIASLGSSVANSARVDSLQQSLNTLIAQRSTALTNIAQSATEGRSTLSLITNAGAGAKVSPKPSLYAVIGFVVALLVFAQLIVYLDPRRRRA